MADEGSETRPSESGASEEIRETRHGWRELYMIEDWWANWFALALIVSSVSGLVTRVPKIGRWESNPLDAFPSNFWLPLGILGIGTHRCKLK